MDYIIYGVYYLSRFYINLMVIRAFLSWPAAMGADRLPKFVQTAYRISFALTEPAVRPFRKLMSRVNTGAFDFSILAAVMAIYLAQYILVRLLVTFAI
jgi:YggT family protein